MKSYHSHTEMSGELLLLLQTLDNLLNLNGLRSVAMFAGSHQHSELIDLKETAFIIHKTLDDDAKKLGVIKISSKAVTLIGFDSLGLHKLEKFGDAKVAQWYLDAKVAKIVGDATPITGSCQNN